MANATAAPVTLAAGDRVTVNGKEYIVGELPWPKAEHRAVLELLVPGGRYDPTPHQETSTP